MLKLCDANVHVTKVNTNHTAWGTCGHSGHHFVYYLAYIIGAKFEQHHSNISQDILDLVIYLCTETICDIINS